MPYYKGIDNETAFDPKRPVDNVEDYSVSAIDPDEGDDADRQASDLKSATSIDLFAAPDANPFHQHIVERLFETYSPGTVKTPFDLAEIDKGLEEIRGKLGIGKEGDTNQAILIASKYMFEQLHNRPKDDPLFRKLGVDTSMAWCMNFVNATLRLAGRDGTHSAWAPGVAHLGVPVREPLPGDFALEDNNGHVGIYLGNGKMLSGNYSHTVEVSSTQGYHFYRPHLNELPTVNSLNKLKATASVDNPTTVSATNDSLPPKPPAAPVPMAM